MHCRSKKSDVLFMDRSPLVGWVLMGFFMILGFSGFSLVFPGRVDRRDESELYELILS